MIKVTKKISELLDELKATSPETFFHALKVKNLVYKILIKSNEVGLTEYSQEEVNAICKGALLHDVGKIGVENVILTKEHSLSDEEKNRIREHTIKGVNLIKDELEEDEYDIVTNICMYHHDRIDGNGYHGKKDIPLYVQLVSVCDAYEALCADRVYRLAYSPEKAMEIIEDNGCGKFDQKVLDCLRLITKNMKAAV